MEEEGANRWGAALDPLLLAFSRLASEDLARCSLVCKSWAALLLSSAPWEAALRREYG